MAWADPKPARGLVDGAPGTKAALLFKPTPAALEAWATAWRRRCGGRPLAVWLEPSRGPLISALLPSDVWGLAPMPPTTLAPYRDAVSPSRATAEPRAADSRRARRVPHRDRRQAWRPDQAQTRPRHERVASRRRLVHDRTRLSPRMTAVLNAAFPPI
jgi:hypothetical protein